MAASLTAPAGAAPLPGPRVVSERTFIYSCAPVVTGISTPVAIPNGVAPGCAMTTAAMSSGPMPYGPSFIAPAMAPAPAPCAIPAVGDILPMGNVWSPPPPPRRLTAGFPSPEAIEQQKSIYNQRLEADLRHGEEMLKLQQKQHTDYIRQAAEAQKKEVACQVQQNAKEHELQLSHQFYQRKRCLQAEYLHQKLVLEKQATDLAMEYQRRRAQEELMVQQYEMQKTHQEDQMRLEEQNPSSVPLGPIFPSGSSLVTIATQPPSVHPTAVNAGLAGRPVPDPIMAGSPSSVASPFSAGSPCAAYAHPLSTASTAYAVSSPVCMGSPTKQRSKMPMCMTPPRAGGPPTTIPGGSPTACNLEVVN